MLSAFANESYGLFSTISIPGFKRVLFEANAVKRLGFKFPSFYLEALRFGVQAYAVTPLEYGVVEDAGEWESGRFAELVEDSIHYHVAMELEIMIEEIDSGNPEHQRLIGKWRSKALAFRARAERSIARFRPHGIAYFQGYYLEASVLRALAIMRDLPLCAWENSFLSDRLLWDSKSGITVNRNQANEYDQKFKGEVSSKVLLSSVAQTMESIKERKSDEHASPRALKAMGSDRPVVLFIGQVYTDSSLLFGRNCFHDTVDTIQSLLDYCERNKYCLVVKLHPKEYSGANPLGVAYHQLSWRKVSDCPRLVDAFSHGPHICDRANKYDTYGLIDIANVVVTINSQAGLEAAVLNKPVVLCGCSFYKDAGFVEHVPNPESLEPALHDAQSQWSSERHLRACEFFNTFTQSYCIANEKRAVMRHLKSIFLRKNSVL